METLSGSHTPGARGRSDYREGAVTTVVTAPSAPALEARFLPVKHLAFVPEFGLHPPAPYVHLCIQVNFLVTPTSYRPKGALLNVLLWLRVFLRVLAYVRRGVEVMAILHVIVHQGLTYGCPLTLDLAGG